MARNERVASTIERDSMVSEPPMDITILPTDLRQVAAVSDLAHALDAPKITVYWKSAPYLLNFMRDYALQMEIKFLKSISCKSKMNSSIGHLLTLSRLGGG